MRVLVLNCGSSSVKYQLVETSLERMETDSDRILARGIIDRIGTSSATHVYRPGGGEPSSEPREVPEHGSAVAEIVRTLTDSGRGVIPSAREIDAVGHRVVHGGETFSRSVLWTSEVTRQIEACSELAPLHNPLNLEGYRAARRILPGVPHAAVFDTAFHQTMPPVAYLYGLPYELYTRHAIRRYGFHGTSHRFVAWRSRTVLGRPLEATRLVTCHLGNGASVAAIDRGRSVETSMGFTPLEGLLMGTRCGDVDPVAIFHVMRREGLSPDEASALMNRSSGLRGISGVSNDMREVLAAEAAGNERAKIAVDLFCYRLKKYIAAYAGVMGGVDAVVFTGGIGENSPEVRARSVLGLGFLGLRLDAERNAAAVGREGEISADGSPVRLLVIPTNEELMIARDTVRLVEGAL